MPTVGDDSNAGGQKIFFQPDLIPMNEIAPVAYYVYQQSSLVWFSSPSTKTGEVDFAEQGKDSVSSRTFMSKL